jgi:hypothetical protein
VAYPIGSSANISKILSNSTFQLNNNIRHLAREPFSIVAVIGKLGIIDRDCSKGMMN